MLRAAAVVEQTGLPAASIIASGFLKQAEMVVKGLGVPLAIGVYPGPPMVDSEQELKRKVEEILAPGLLEGLVGAPPSSDATYVDVDPEPGQIVFSGDFDEVQEHFHRQLWSDGLPIVPPTRQRVDAFLSFTDLAPDHVIRIVPQDGREASILSIAITGVMAGCRPEYMPVLIAVIEAMCDPVFRIQDCGSTPGWEPLVILNGPVIKQLDFNYGQGLMRVGRQANSSVGRFVRMFLRNICGYRIPPGAGDKASIAQSFFVAMAEDEDTAREIGWPTFAEERGFASSESVVTVQSVVHTTPPTYTGGARAIDHVRLWSDSMGHAFIPFAHSGMRSGVWNPLIVAGPSIAKVIASEWSKDDVRRFLHEHTTVSAELLTRFSHASTTDTFNFERWVADGLLPPEYAASSDPQRLVNVFIKPEMIGLLVAGDPGRNQSRGYMSNHIQGVPVSRRMAFPSGWAERIQRIKGR